MRTTNAHHRRAAGLLLVVACLFAALSLPGPSAAAQEPQAAGAPAAGSNLLADLLAALLGLPAPSPAPLEPSAPPPANPVQPVAEATLDLGLPVCGLVPLVKSPILGSGGPLWQCTFADEFNGTRLDGTKWVAQTTAASGFHSGAECFMDRRRNIAVANGTLRLTVRQEPNAFTCASPLGSYPSQWTAGSVMTYDRFSQAYGRFEIRAKFPPAKVRGLHTAFWLWPDDPLAYGPWPWSGEIDIAEFYSVYPDRAIPYVHYAPSGWDFDVTNNYCIIDDVTKFHTYTAEWTPTSITILYDNKVCIKDTWMPAWPLVKPQPFDKPFMVALTQALGIGINAFHPAVTPLPATTVIDYVRVWK